jgi:sensor histidine kinase YesM
MNTHLVSLHEELQMRFGKAIQVNFPEERSGMLPPLALQLLVENAIKHNAHSLKHPLVVDIRSCDGYLLISNKIQPLSSNIDSTGLGLSNLRERYQLLFGREIEVVDNDQTFTVKIPVL